MLPSLTPNVGRVLIDVEWTAVSEQPRVERVPEQKSDSHVVREYQGRRA